MKLLVLAALIALVAASQWTSASAPMRLGRLELSAPVRVDAGADATVVVHGDAPDGTQVDVAFFSALGARHESAILGDGRATVTVPAELAATAGLVTVVAAAGDELATAQMVIEAGPIVEPVVPLLGARSIVADAADHAMVVVIAEDAYGNPQPDGSLIEISLARENGERLGQTSETRGGVAWAWLPAGTDAGQTLVGARSGAVTGPAAHLQEVPGAPVAVELSADRLVAPADGRGLVVVETDELVDGNGNRLLDGTAVTFTTVGPAGQSVASTPTVGGRATTVIQAPEMAGDVVVRAAVGGLESSPLSIRFEALPGLHSTSIPVEAIGGPESLAVVVGPVVGQEGAYVPDGARVSGSVAGVDAACLTTGGRCRLLFPPDVRGVLTVTVMGRVVVTPIGADR